MKTNFTIIIITHNRPNYLKRLLDYYSSYKVGYKIIVSDSSSEEKKTIDKEIISSFPELDILYLGHYLDKVHEYRHQAADAVNYIKTKYCALCADDDFITPNGIEESVDFLEKNHDFTLCHGRFACFYLDKRENGEFMFYFSPDNTDKTIVFPEPELRLKAHLSNLTVTLYSVFRSDFMKMIFSETSKFTNDERFGELMPSVLALIYGKMKCLDLLYEVRERIPTSSGVSNKTMETFIEKGTYNEKYKKFRECLAWHLRQATPLNTKEAGLVVDQAMKEYLEKNYPNSLKSSAKRLIKNMFKSLSLSEQYVKVRSLYLKNKYKNSQVNNDFLVSFCGPESKYYQDINKIKNCVLTNT